VGYFRMCSISMSCIIVCLSTVRRTGVLPVDHLFVERMRIFCMEMRGLQPDYHEFPVTLLFEESLKNKYGAGAVQFVHGVGYRGADDEDEDMVTHPQGGFYAKCTNLPGPDPHTLQRYFRTSLCVGVNLSAMTTFLAMADTTHTKITTLESEVYFCVLSSDGNKIAPSMLFHDGGSEDCSYFIGAIDMDNTLEEGIIDLFDQHSGVMRVSLCTMVQLKRHTFERSIQATSICELCL